MSPPCLTGCRGVSLLADVSSYTATTPIRLRRALRLKLHYTTDSAAGSLLLFLLALPSVAQPIVIDGTMLRPLLGTPLERLRMTDWSGNPLPFQVDEVVADGEYVCPSGPEPNSGQSNGVLDSNDEVVFLFEDASAIGAAAAASLVGSLPKTVRTMNVIVDVSGQQRTVIIHDNRQIALSPKRYVAYDAATQTVTTPWYHATFGHDRFHFVGAGLEDFAAGRYLDLTNELRVEIRLRLFWGLIPVHYTEDKLVCLVKRYKLGPIRLIRRGDFHLNLGLGIKGSRAVVNQVCYPQTVGVPVRVHLPVRFRSFFREAYIEMTPVLNAQARGFSFNVPRRDLHFACDSGASRLDTLVSVDPDNTLFRVDNAQIGFGWLLHTSIDPAFMGEASGYVFARPSTRGGVAQCGYRLGLQDLPKGHYLIANWVLFSSEGLAGLDNLCRAIQQPPSVQVGNGPVRKSLLQ
jgi:hypothetical protein